MKILVIAAHPDDEVLGMGGTLKKLSAQKHKIKVVFLATGIFARRSAEYKNSTRYQLDKNLEKKMKNQVSGLRNDAKNALKILGIKNLNRKYDIEDMIKGDVIFCATGVTDGEFVKGIKDLGDTFSSETLVLHKSSKTNKIVKNIIKK